MIMERWLSRAVTSFWTATDVFPPFPRDIEMPALLVFTLAVIELEHLGPKVIQHWLRSRGIRYAVSCAERRLHGGLLAYAGTGIIFLDAADNHAERCFTFAHELAHFWLDYLCPRQEALRVHGPAVTEVLDGYRSATPAERLTGILTGNPLGLFVDLMQRRPGGGIAHVATLGSEERADRLAMEWLAPLQDVQSRLADLNRRLSRTYRQQEAVRIIMQEFGLPAWVAEQLARKTLSRIDGPVQFAEWLHG